MSTLNGGSRVGAGREYRFRDILASGWRQFRANWGRAVGYALLLTMLAGVIGVLCVFGGMLLLFMVMALSAMLSRALFESGVSTIVGDITMVSAPAGVVFSFIVLSQGFLWSAVVSFPAGRLRWGRIFDFLFHARFWRTVGYGSLLTLLWFLILAALIAGFWFYAFGAGPAALVLSHIPLADTLTLAAVGPALWLLHGLVMFATLLVGPIMLRSGVPRLWRAWGEHFRIVRGQPRRVMAVVAVAVAAQCLLWWLLLLCSFLIWARAGASSAAAGSPVIVGLIAFLSYLLASLLFLLLYSFVVAALFRTAYGLPIAADTAPVPAEERLEEIDLSGLRPVQRSDDDAHPADDT